MTVGDRIKRLRKERNLTQDEVGAKIGTSKQTLYKYENGIITNIPSDKIEILANIFDCSPAYLMGWEDESNDGIQTIAAHHDDEEWTEEELAEIEAFKQFVKSKRNK